MASLGQFSRQRVKEGLAENYNHTFTNARSSRIITFSLHARQGAIEIHACSSTRR